MSDVRRLILWGAAPISLLLVPLVAMQITDEVKWNFSDFVFASLLLSATGLTCAVMTRSTNKIIYRLAIGCFVLILIALIWIEAAVGIFT